MKYTSAEIRKKYLEFFREKGHAIVPSAPLVPENDATVLFNTAGMQPMVPYLMGEKHPMGNRIADSQKCVRTGDLEEVGDDTHNTFFEMLGNWSFGDYFKKEAIEWSYEFLTSPKWLNLDPKYIAVTVFEGDDDAPRDEEAADIWKSVGMPSERISFLPKSENWWAAGDTGPCGPDTEIFYWVGMGEPPTTSNVENDEDNWMEIWNNVFMMYNRETDGTLTELPNKNIDTGMGLGRILATLNGKTTVYDTDLFMPALEKIFALVGKENYNKTSARIIADHIRCGVHLIADGIIPKNIDQGYVLRRLLRRAIREAHKMGYEQNILCDIAEIFIDIYKDVYINIKTKKTEILNELYQEEERFRKTLSKGLKEFEKLLRGFEIAFERSGKKVTQIAGAKAFKLYDTYGFPLEMTKELADEHSLTVDEEGFQKAFKEHQDKARTASAGKFKGGLADHGEATTQLHTATHLLLAGLQKVLGNHVHQAGSNITPERLRFDFTHPEKVTPEQIAEVEQFVNDAIASKATMQIETMDKQVAKDSGVEGSFWEKYPDSVTVYKLVGSEGTTWSHELCGGPHVETTEWMGTFKVMKEQASSAGVRRIKAKLI